MKLDSCPAFDMDYYHCMHVDQVPSELGAVLLRGTRITSKPKAFDMSPRQYFCNTFVGGGGEETPVL
jgi:hypothetical protein